MFSKYIFIIFLLLGINLTDEEIIEAEERLLNSMSFEELLNTEIATGVPPEQKLAPAVTTILPLQR